MKRFVSTVCFAGLIGNGFTGVVSAQRANTSFISIEADEQGYLHGSLGDIKVGLKAQLVAVEVENGTKKAVIKLKDGRYLQPSGKYADQFSCFGEAPHKLKQWAKSKFDLYYSISVN